MMRLWWNRISLAVGVGGLAAALLATTPALGAAGRTPVAPAATGVKIMSATSSATIVLKHPPHTSLIVKLALPAGKWALSGKLWGDSVPATVNDNTVVRCALQHGSKFLDISVFNVPRLNGTSAGTLYLGAVISLSSRSTVVMNCDDIGSNAQVHNAELTAIGG